MYLMSLKEENDKVDPIWYQMYLSIGFMEVEQNSYQSDLFEACVIRKVSGILLDDYWGFSSPKPLDFTGRAMVGLNVNDVDWLSTERYPISDSIPRDELKNMHFKLKIYACDDMEWLFVG